MLLNLTLLALLVGLLIQVDAYQWYVENLLFAVEKYKYAAEGNRLNYLDCAFHTSHPRILK